MLPTLTIPSVPRPPSSGEPTGPVAAENGSRDGFADALQRAQDEPRPARTHESRPQAPKAADSHARSNPAQAKGAAPADTATPDDAAATESVVPATTDDAAVVDALTRGTDAGQDAAQGSASPAIVVDAAMAQTMIAANRIAPQRAATDSDDELASAIDSHGKRPASRLAASELRTAQPSHGQTTQPADSTSTREATTALPLGAAVERATNEVAAAPVGAPHAPSFERAPLEAAPSMLAAAVLARDSAGAATAAGTESRLPQATLRAAIDEPAFGAAVGSQVAVWVRDGVQEARLQLHPAELGPVSVQIALDGQAAHVDFTAAVAATRESIEQSLPALAAALRESGFTLAGGGVSSDAGQAGHEAQRERASDGIGGDRSRTDAGIDAGPALTVPRRWTRSLLDVYA
jgi:flagellar hook-length control protein FliK